MSPIPTDNLKCPHCDTALVLVNNQLPDKCAKCGISFKAFDNFEQLMDAYINKKKKQIASRGPVKDEGEDGFFDILGKI